MFASMDDDDDDDSYRIGAAAVFVHTRDDRAATGMVIFDESGAANTKPIRINCSPCATTWTYFYVVLPGRQA